jgi:hypothetical protein
MTTQLWVSDNGDIICADHAGTCLRVAIEADASAIQHSTPLDNWALYATNLIGGENLVCEICTPWDSPNHPYNKIKAGA